jgi:hypothetical protein
MGLNERKAQISKEIANFDPKIEKLEAEIVRNSMTIEESNSLIADLEVRIRWQEIFIWG